MNIHLEAEKVEVKNQHLRTKFEVHLSDTDGWGYQTQTKSEMGNRFPIKYRESIMNISVYTCIKEKINL